MSAWNRSPFKIGKRQFYGWEFWFVGWNHWVFGIYWGHEPEIHLGPWMLRLDED